MFRQKGKKLLLYFKKVVDFSVGLAYNRTFTQIALKFKLDQSPEIDILTNNNWFAF